MDTQLPVDLLSWLLAALPIVVLLFFLLILRWSAPEAGAVGMFTAAGIALLFFRTPLETLTIASAKGVWDAVFILYVVWTALLLYHIANRAGAFDALRLGLMAFSQNELFLVLTFGWVFVSFLQGITGFGTPVAMVAPLLVALGVRPLYAVAIPLIGHAWGNQLGTLGVAWLATEQVVALQDSTTTAFQMAILLWLPNFAAGMMIAWMYGRGRAVQHMLPFILVISLLHGGIQLALTLWNPILSNFLAVTAGFIALVPLSRLKRYNQPSPLPPSPIMQPVLAQSSADAPMSLPIALLPYAILTVAAITALVPPFINEVLADFQIGFAFPAISTGYGVARGAGEPYAPFAPLTHPGTFLLIAALLTGLIYRVRGYYTRPASRPLWVELVNDAVPSSLAIIAFLVLSKLMDHSGQTTVLALGISAVTPPTVYAFFASSFGVLGAFMTSSNTASNVLFAPVQQTIATIQGLPEASIIAAQGAGAAVGNAIAPANTVLGTGPVGILGQEGAVLRLTLLWSIVLTLLVGAVTVLLIGLSG
jgi:lactate permease